jgi:hypothetical protein
MNDTPVDRENDAAWGFVSPGETRFPAAISVVAVLVLQVLLPDRLTIGPPWLIPAIEAAVLLTLIIVGPSKLTAETKDVRFFALSLVGILIVANSTTLGILIHDLLRQGNRINGRSLIYSAIAVWFTAVTAFGLLYWEIDRGGPVKRCTVDHDQPDFLFPQMENPNSSATRWSPRFIDYLYLSLTNSTAFSPTDALPLTARAKTIMAVQSLASLGTVVIVGARAVNILN